MEIPRRGGASSLFSPRLLSKAIGWISCCPIERLAEFGGNAGSVVSGYTAKRLMVVECDGHEYHCRTKEQAQRNRFRDRSIQGMGTMVFRYTGAEIWRDVFECVKETVGILMKGS